MIEYYNWKLNVVKDEKEAAYEIDYEEETITKGGIPLSFEEIRRLGKLIAKKRIGAVHNKNIYQ